MGGRCRRCVPSCSSIENSLMQPIVFGTSSPYVLLRECSFPTFSARLYHFCLLHGGYFLIEYLLWVHTKRAVSIGLCRSDFDHLLKS